MLPTHMLWKRCLLTAPSTSGKRDGPVAKGCSLPPKAGRGPASAQPPPSTSTFRARVTSMSLLSPAEETPGREKGCDVGALSGHWHKGQTRIVTGHPGQGLLLRTTDVWGGPFSVGVSWALQDTEPGPLSPPGRCQEHPLPSVTTRDVPLWAGPPLAEILWPGEHGVGAKRAPV